MSGLRAQMGAIREVSSGRVQVLEPEHLIGRAPVSASRLREPYVSAQHALIRWSGTSWEVKDLGSRNGTFLDGQRLRAGEEFTIERGARIAFGKADGQWELVDDEAPLPMAVPLDGGDPVLSDGELLALPSSEDPRVTIYRSTEGSWLLEQPSEAISPISNLQTIDVGGRTWRFCCVEDVLRTSLPVLPELEVRHLRLLFSVSSDEEHVHLEVTCGNLRFDLGSRTHNYLLLTLARRRLADTAEGLPESSCGWTYQEDLASDPSMAPPQLNNDVFRIRKQFASVGVVDAGSIVERRPRTRQLRIGTGALAVAVV